MNATTFFNATKLAQKPAAIGFAAIIGLGLSTALATAVSTLLALLIPVLLIITKAAIFGYPLFLAGLIAMNPKEQCQKKEAPTIAILPPGKPYKKLIKQTETIQNDVLITPPSVEAIFDYQLRPKPPTWQQQILKEIQQNWKLPTEIKEALEATKVFDRPRLNTASHRDANPFNQLTITTICWQAMSQVSELLDKIKASEMKSIAAELKIPKYRQMNKTQLLLEIVEAHNNAPEFSQ